jgi:hypothetical protein
VTDRNRTGRGLDAAAGTQERNDVWSSAAFLLGLTQGAVPLVTRALLDRAPIWAVPARLPSPWWWIASVAMVLLAFAALAALDRAKTGGSADA